MANDPHVIKHSRPHFSDAHVYNSTIADAHGSTSGTLSRYGPSFITTTATGLNYTLPAPQVGLTKELAVMRSAGTGTLTIRANTTAVFFGGSTFNIITVASGEPLAAFRFVGIDSDQWSVLWSGTPTTGTASIAFAGATY